MEVRRFMLVKKLVALGLSAIISLGLVVPVNASTSANRCQSIPQVAKLSLEAFQEDCNETVGCTKNYRSNRTYLTPERAIQVLKAYLKKVEELHRRGIISEARYKRIKKYVTERIRRLEDSQKEKPKPDPDNGKPTPQPDPDNGKPTPQPPNPDTNLTSEEQRMVNLVNEARRQHGVKPLIVHKKLTEVARLKSQDMIDNNYFSHHSPVYGSPFDMLKRFGISYRMAGENIAGNQSVDRAHTSLMNSSGHRRNILNPSYTHVGIGIRNGGRYGKMFTQLFIRQ